MKLQKDKIQEVRFDLRVEGTIEKVIPRLILKNQGFSVVYEGQMKEHDAVFIIDKLNKLFENDKKVEAEVEVIVEGRYFKPWKSLIEFDEPIKVQVFESTATVNSEIPSVQVKEKFEHNKPLKITLNGKMQEVFVLRILESTNLFKKLEVLDENGQTKTIRIKNEHKKV